MPTEFEFEVALAVMDMLTTRLNQSIKAGGFNNDSVSFMIKAWTKVGMLIKGDGFHKATSTYYSMNRDATPTTEKRSLKLQMVLGALETYMTNNKKAEGDFFERANNEMRDFVWFYRKSIAGNNAAATSEKVFVAFLMKWMSTSAEDAKKAVVAGIEQHA